MRQFACNMGKGQNFVFHSCFYSCRTTNSHIRYSSHLVRNPFPSTWPMVLRTPRAHPCGWSFNHFHVFTRNPRGFAPCLLLISKRCHYDILSAPFFMMIGTIDHRFVLFLAWILWENRVRIFCDILLIVNCFATNSALFICNLSYEFFAEIREIKRICLHLLILERVWWMFRNQCFLSLLRVCEIVW